MKILLTGATGFLGSRTLEKLVQLEEVESVIATGRTLKDSHKVDHPKVIYQLGELTDKNFVSEIVSQVDHIIHAAALSSPWGKYEEFEKANLHSQINILNQAKNSNIKKYVYISTPSMYFNQKDRTLVKESDPLPHPFINSYAETKRLAEIELEQSDVPFVIIRPRALIGRGDTVIMPRLVRAFDEGRLKIIGTGENLVDLASVENVVDAIILGLKAEGPALNETYNISNGDPVKLWDKIGMVLELMGKQAPQKKVPYSVVKFVAWMMETKSKLTNMKEPTLTVYGVGTLAKTFTLDISKARNLLGYEPKVTTDESINEFVKWYMENEER